jgi:Arc/MetJ-type ribon-helix-helix transcriptional regulator
MRSEQILGLLPTWLIRHDSYAVFPLAAIGFFGRRTPMPPRLGKSRKPWYSMEKEHNEMTIHLPPHIERSIQAAVHNGRYASLDDAMTEAATLLVQRLEREQAQAKPPAAATDDLPPDPILGLMRDDAELMDEIVADAYRRRREEKWRDIDL